MEMLLYVYSLWFFVGVFTGLYFNYFRNRTAVYLTFGRTGVFLICCWLGPALIVLAGLIKIYNILTFVSFYCQIWFWLMYYERRNPVSAARYAREFGYSEYYTPKEAVYTNWTMS